MAGAARPPPARRGTLWIDISDLFHDFRFARHPTGVSRMTLGLADALAAEPGQAFAAARPLFWLPGPDRPYTIEGSLGPLADFFPQLEAAYREAGLAPRPYSSRLMRAVATSMPRAWRYRLFPADGGATLFALWAERRGVTLAPVSLGPADGLFLPGSFWLALYMRRLMAAARAAGVPVTAFVHDMLFLSHPEWRPPHAGRFRRGLQALLPRCAAIVCNSQVTAGEVRRFIRLPAGLPIATCRFADAPPPGPSPPSPAAARWLGERYVLVVGTLVARKNHALVVEAWRRLWRRLGAATPWLLLAGGGAPDAPLARALAQEQAEGARVVRLGGVEDADLETLYRHAWLTAFPSLGEGYGMPVAEALSRGKVCLAGAVKGVSEAGAGLIDEIDPNDPESVVARVLFYLEDPARLAAREAEIRRGFRPTRWPDTAREVRAVLEAVGAAQVAARTSS